MSKSQILSLTPDQIRLLKGACRRGWIDVAEHVGLKQQPFERIAGEVGGFDPAQRFILEQAFSGDETAIRLRDQIIQWERWRWLGLEPEFPLQPDLRPTFFQTRERQFSEFRRAHYSWKLSELLEGVRQPWPEAEIILADYVRRHFAEAGFENARERSTKTAWRISTRIESRNVHVEFDRGSLSPATRCTGSIRIPDFDFGISIAYPFFFSGGPQFSFSKSDFNLLQLETFFAAFSKLTATYLDLITSTVDEGNRFFTQR